MSNNDENVEQITKTPSNVPKREKDPKRVAAGKKLAESNRRMREEHARYKTVEAQKAEQDTAEPPTPEKESTATGSSEWLPKLSLTNAISLVGIGLTVYNLFVRSKDTQVSKPPSNINQEPWREPVTTTLTKVPSFGM